MNGATFGTAITDQALRLQKPEWVRRREIEVSMLAAGPKIHIPGQSAPIPPWEFEELLFRLQNIGRPTPGEIRRRPNDAGIIRVLKMMTGYLLMLPERYDPDDWWGPGYRAVFDNPTGDVVHDFLPQNPAEILPRLPQILEHARAYIEYRHRRCRWAINEIRRDIVADQIEFKHALEWAVRSPGGIEKLLADIEKEPRYKELAAWTRYEWIRRNTPEEFRTRHAEAVARLLKRGTAELAARPPVVPEPTLSLFGLDPLSPPEQYEQDVRLQPWRLSVQWAITALQLLDLIEGRLELRFENRGRRPLVLPHEGHPDA